MVEGDTISWKPHLKKIIRSIKIEKITDEVHSEYIKSNVSEINNRIEDFKKSIGYKVYRKFPNVILTGSMSLDITFGLSRIPIDMDLITLDRNIKDLEKNINYFDPDIYLGYKYVTVYKSDNTSFGKMWYGQKAVRKVDFFNYDARCIEISGIKIQHPLDLLEIKIEMYNNNNKPNFKHIKDVFEISKKYKLIS